MDTMELSSRDRLINQSPSQDYQYRHSLPAYEFRKKLSLDEGSKSIQIQQPKQKKQKDISLQVMLTNKNYELNPYNKMTEEQFEQIEDLYDMSRTYYQSHKLHGTKSVFSFKKFFKSIPTLRPNSFLMLMWEAFIAILILFLFFTIPIYVSFGRELFDELGDLNIFYLSVSMFALLFIDMILEFFTAYYQHGALITKKSKIAKHYVKSMFLFDVIAITIFGILTFFTINTQRWLYFLFYFKLYSLNKIDEIINEGTLLYRRIRNFYGIFKIVIFFFYSVDVFACGFYLVGYWSHNHKMDSWLDLQVNSNQTIIKQPYTQQFLLSSFFSMGTLTTTMGYGKIVKTNLIKYFNQGPTNNFECLYCGLGILFGVFILSVIINYMHKFMEDYNQKKIKIRNKRICINKFLESKNVPSEIKTRVKQQLNEHWQQEGSRNLEEENQIIRNELHGQLQEALIYTSYGAFLQKIKFFSENFSDQFLRALSFQITEITLSAGETLFKDKKITSQKDNSLYFIASGSIIIKPNIENTKQIFSKKLKQDEYFGEYSFFTGMGRQASVEAQSFTNLYKISRQDFIKTIVDYPEDFEQYHFIRDKILFSKDMRVINSSCWFCKKVDHYFTQCPLIHYIPNTMKLIKEKEQNTEKQVRIKIKRSQKVKWPTLKKLEIVQARKPSQKKKRHVIKKQQTQYLNLQEKPELDDRDQFAQSMKLDKDQVQLSQEDQSLGEQSEVQEMQKVKKKEMRDRDIDQPANFKRYFNRNNQQIIEIFQSGNIRLK